MSETPVFTDLRRTLEWTCPECGSDHYDVGEVDGQILTCEGCSKTVLVRWPGLSAEGVVAEEPEWQFSYVEKWADGSGVYERVTFDREAQARKHLRDNAEHVEGLNQEFNAEDHIVASIEKRVVHTPGEWVPVKQEGQGER